MARRGQFRNQRIDDKICVLLEQRMATERRRGSLNAYIEEILDKWVNGFVVDSENFKREVSQKIEEDYVKNVARKTEESLPSRKVHKIGPAKGVIEDNERKREAS